MYVFTLNAQSRKNVENATGMAFDAIIDMDFDDLDKEIAKKIKKNLGRMKSDDPRLLTRGQVYHVLDRMVDMEEIDRKLQELLDLK